MRTHILSFSLVGVVLGAAWGCGGDSVTDCISTRTCSYSEEGGTASDAGLDGDSAVVVPPGCDLTKDPKDAPACVDNGVGVFVAPTGSDTSSGSKELPLKTIGKGVELAASRGLPRVYVCEGTYAESVSIKKTTAIYGGFACADFSHTGAKPRVQPNDGMKYALDVQAANVTVADLELVGPAPGAPNSIAVRAIDSSNLTFVRSKLEARDGANGAVGTRTDFTGFPLQAALNGKDASGATGGPAYEVTCPGGAKTTGGKGGDNGFGGDPGTPALAGGAGGVLGQSCAGTGTGGDGATGTSSGGTGAATRGELLQNTWTPRAGQNGPAGSPGQGGGGGQGAGGGGGGGGGSGGCGGAGGGGGSGGGASIALLSIASTIVLRESELVAAQAGNGGAGVSGQQGQQISGFGGTKTAGGCNGGAGGKGGEGGAGGGGAGGISVAFVHKGTKPTIEPTTTIKKGTAGTKGAGGAPGTNDGIDGVAEESLELQ